jgi:alginate O-acetyltransferase complex protein AlgI
LSQYSDVVFKAAGSGVVPTFADAWIGCLAFGLQIYFDFSGYSDIAVGLAALFGIKLPFNFASPYKSCSVIEFWRRWHITLSRFLRDYLYIPMGGNRHGSARQHVNLMVTMALGGLWHGAAWTFVAWGILHGSLSINHLWRSFCSRTPALENLSQRPGMAVVSWAVTFVLVNFAWCLFRAPSFAAAVNVGGAMLHLLPEDAPVYGWQEFTAVAGLVGWVVLLPNSQEIVQRVLEQRDVGLALVGAGQSVVFLFAVYFMLVHQYENFIYFMF